MPKTSKSKPVRYPESPEQIGSINPAQSGASPLAGITLADTALAPLHCAYRDDAHGIYLYQGDCLAVLDAIAAKHPAGCFDMIFADPPYFLSNGGITCKAGKMVSVHKGDWDKSRGAEENHNFNRAWLERCQRVLKPNGTIWVTGTHHVIFSVGYAMQQLGMKILNDIAWEKPNPPPNLSCRYFTHSTETVLWAAKSDQSKHLFNYKEMKQVTGKQMKTVWTMSAPGKAEKLFGKHPTQKPVALVERCLLAATNAGDMVLDPFMGGGTTAVASVRTYRHFVGIELDITHLLLAGKRADREVIQIWLREFRVRVTVSASVADQNDLDHFRKLIDPIYAMPDKPDIAAESIFHETKFVFLSCAQARTGSVVHTTVDADVQSAWSHTPQSIKLQTTHVVRCETEILRVKNS